MADVNITGAPNIKVSGLSIKRTGNSFKATWKIPADAKKGSNARRWTGQKIEWVAYTGAYDSKGKWKVSKALTKTVSLNINTTSHSFSVSDIAKKIYPQKASPYLKKVVCTLYGKNGKGSGPGQPSTYSFAQPANPTFTIEFDESTNTVTAHMSTANEASGTNHRYDTLVTVKRNGQGGAATYLNGSKTWTAWNPSYFVNNSDSLTAGQWIRIDATARNRGYWGSSSVVTRSVYIAHPTVPSCGTPVVNFATKDVYETASVYVPVSDAGLVIAKKPDGEAANVWPETLYLHRLKNSLATTPTEAAQSGSWEAVDGAEARGQASGLMDTWADATGEVEPGKKVWYRIVAEKDGYIQYGVPVWAECLFVPASESGQSDATLGNVRSGTDGESIIVPVSWTQASVDGVELSWSVNEDAWHSNEKPATLDVDWGENKAATATIRGLSVGVPVYVKARCFDLDSDGNKTYGGYSSAVMVVPYDAPESVTASAPATVPVGGEIAVEWTFDSDSPQQWADVLVDGDAIKSSDGGDGHTVNGSDGATAISTEGLSLGEHTVTVMLSTDGATSIGSNECKVLVANPPTGTIVVNGIQDTDSSSDTYGLLVVTAQPISFTLDTTADSPVAVIAVIADGCSGDEIRDAQPRDQVIWSSRFSGEQLAPPGESTDFALTSDEDVVDGKAYYEFDGERYVRVENPEASGLSSYYEYTGTAWVLDATDGIDLRDLCGYSVRCSIADGSNGLSASLPPATFAVHWAHQAVEPEGTATAGDSGLSAIITIPEPSGAISTDVLDLYRVTPNGQYLIASDREFGTPIVDNYAPFKSRKSDAELRYRAVLRTADGDLEFSDIPYDLFCGSLRLDWNENSVELPYDISRGDSFSKDFGSRVHADGSRSGWWSPAVEHNSSLSTNLIKIRSVEQREALMDMASYSGPVFVRTPEGMAYPANVDLGSIELSTSTMAISVSLNASEVGFNDDFLAVPVEEED